MLAEREPRAMVRFWEIENYLRCHGTGVWVGRYTDVLMMIASTQMRAPRKTS
jgi:hypothetical protein